MVKVLTNSREPGSPPLGALLAAAAHHLSEALNEALSSAGYADLRAAHAPVFLNIDAEGTRSTVLANRAGMSKQAMGELLGHLTRAGYVASENDPQDRRARLCRLTTKGWTALAVARQVINSFDDWLDAEVGADRVTELRDTLDLILTTDPTGWEATRD